MKHSDDKQGTNIRLFASLFLLLASFLFSGTSSSVLAGDISGRVTNGTVGIPDFYYIYLYPNDTNSYIDYAVTDVDGNYTFTGLSAGDYKLKFDGGGYISEWYNGKADFAGADPVSVPVTGTIIVNDVVLEQGGSVTGNVTDSGTGAPITGVGVTVYDTNNISTGFAWTDATGDFTVSGLPTGNYKIQFDGSGPGYFGKWYDNKTDFATADLVAVTAPADSGGINAALEPAGTISGQVTNGDTGLGISGVLVNIFMGDNSQFPSYAGLTITDVNGNYTVGGLQSGIYKVLFDASGTNYPREWYNDIPASLYVNSAINADGVLVTAPVTTSDINAVLFPGGSISGRVSDSGTGIAGIRVSANDLTYGMEINAVYTDANGDYTISSLRSDDYKVLFSGGSTGYITEWYNNKPDSDSADIVTVTAPAIAQNIDADLAPGGSISGQVTDGSAGIPNLWVSVSDSITFGTLGLTVTDANGNYTLTGLPSGEYKIHFEASGVNFTAEWYNDKVDFAGADPVLVTAPGITTGVNGVLAPPRPQITITPILMLLMNQATSTP